MTDHSTRVRRVEQRRMLRLMNLRQILPSAGVVGPICKAGCCEVEAGRDLALEGIPRSMDVTGPEDGAVRLCAEICIAGENERSPLRQVSAETIIERLGVEVRVDVEELRAGTDVVESTVRRQIRL